MAQRILGPAAFRAVARAAAAWGTPIVVKRLALVSRWGDVREVLEHGSAYRIEPINGPNFNTISGTFVLGLDRGPQFARERRQMYDAVSRIDVADLRARIRDEADRIIADALGAGDRIDVAHGYAHPVAARSAAYLFGIHGPTKRISCASAGRSFISAFSRTRTRRVSPSARAAPPKSCTPGWSTRSSAGGAMGSRSTTCSDGCSICGTRTARRSTAKRRGASSSGLLVGAIDTTAPTVPRIVYVLASDPALLARVRRDVDDPIRMTGWCWEALRMWAPAPVLFRRTPVPVVLAGRAIPEGCKVAAFTQAAMFDRGVFPLPRQFNPAAAPAFAT